MGKQIEFLQSEEDLQFFLAYLETSGGLVHIGTHVVTPSVACNDIMRKIRTEYCKLFIVQSNTPHADSHALNRAIEYRTCSKGNANSRTYNVGRLYIAPNNAGVYDSQLLDLFEKLRRFIKKNYVYSKKTRIYFGSDFKEKYDRRLYFGLNHVTPIIF